MQRDCPSIESPRQPLILTQSAPPPPERCHGQIESSQHQTLVPITRIAQPPNQGTACLTIGPPSQLTPILPAPVSLQGPPATTAGTLPFLPSSGSVLPPYAQNPLGLLLAQLNGSLMSTDRFSTPLVFRERKLRSGKWIPEEEEYAEVLIQLFEKGFLFDCENGSTLRSYLSRKLHCAPMRISKKYAGKGIGKMLFICRIRLNMSVLAPCPEEIKVLEQRANERELLFYRAVFPEKMLPSPRELFAACSDAGLLAPSLSVAIHPSIVPANRLSSIPTPVPLISSSAPACPNAVVHSFAPVATASNEPQAKSMPQPASVNGVFNAALQKSFFDALQQQTVNLDSSSVHFPASGGPLGAHPVTAALKHLDVAAASGNSSDHEMHGFRVAVTHQVPVPPTAPSLALSHVWPSTASPRTSPGATRTREVNTSTLSPVPDFLAGFDKVKHDMRVNKSHLIHGPAFYDTHQYSPPFTSRSFDDFHRFLGEDLAPLGSPVVRPDQPPIRSASPYHGYDPETIFSLGSVSNAPPSATYLWPGGRSSLICQAAPISSNQNRDVCHENASLLQPAIDTPLPYHSSLIIQGQADDTRYPHYDSASHMHGYYAGAGETAVTMSEHNDSGRSSVDRSSSDQDNLSSASSREAFDESDDTEWQDLPFGKKRRVQIERNPSPAIPPPARSKSKIHAIG